MDRECAGPTGHPRHRNTGEKMPTPSDGQHLGTRMQLDESLQFVVHPLGQTLP
jgi:hypothetical protein